MKPKKYHLPDKDSTCIAWSLAALILSVVGAYLYQTILSGVILAAVALVSGIALFESGCSWRWNKSAMDLGQTQAEVNKN